MNSLGKNILTTNWVLNVLPYILYKWQPRWLKPTSPFQPNWHPCHHLVLPINSVEHRRVDGKDPLSENYTELLSHCCQKKTQGLLLSLLCLIFLTSGKTNEHRTPCKIDQQMKHDFSVSRLETRQRLSAPASDSYTLHHVETVDWTVRIQSLRFTQPSSVIDFKRSVNDMSDLISSDPSDWTV